MPGLSREADAGTSSWTPDGNALYYIDIAAETGVTLRMVQVQDGTVSHIANMAPLSDARIRAMHVHGGRVFLTAETSESNVWIVELLQRH